MELPLPLKIIAFIGGALVFLWSCAQALEYFADKYKQFGPSWITAAHQSWLQSPWKATVMVAFLVGILCAFVGGLAFYLWASNRPKETNNLQLVGLTMSVINYRYDTAADELSAQVQFVNNGKIRRTILGVTFSYRDADVSKNEHHPLVDSAGDVWGHGDPLYVEPGQPVVMSYKRKLGKPELTKTPGIAFGLQVTSLSAEGTMNFATIETMIVTTAMDRPALLSASKRNISLEITTYSPMEDPVVRLPQSPSPSVSPIAPPPSPIAKSDLDRIKILDTPDGPIVTVDELGSMPTPTPQSKPLANLTPRQLFALIEGHSPLRVVKMVEPYQGLWTEAEGEIMHPPLPHGGGCVITIHLMPEDKNHVECRFDKQWCDELDRLKEKETIKVRGKIGHQFGVTLALEGCELISPRRP